MIRGLKESTLFLFIAITLYLIISLFSYSPQDPAWSHTVSSSLAIENIYNLGGHFGALFADITFYLFGYMAYFVPGMIAVTGWVIYKGNDKDAVFNGWFFSLRVFGFVLSVVTGCAIATMHFAEPSVPFPSEIGAGGILGQVVSEQLQSWFNFVGATLFLLTFFLVGITFFSHLSWFWLMDKTGSLVINLFIWILGLWQKWRHKREQKREEQQALLAEFEAVEEVQELEVVEPKSRNKKKALVITQTNYQVEDEQEEEQILAPESGDEEIEKVGISQRLSLLGKKITDNLIPNKDSEEPVENSDPFNQIDKESEVTSEWDEKIEPVFSSFDSSHRDEVPRTTESRAKKSKSKPKVQNNDISEDFQAPSLPDEIIPIEPEISKKPIRVETRNTNIEKSDRLDIDRQTKLFKHDAIDGLPSLTLLDEPQPSPNVTSAEELESTSRLIEQRLLEYNMKVEVVAVQQGPVITRFELQLAPGVKVSQLTNLSKDLARALLVVSIRVVEVIAGKSTVGIEIPNPHREIVYFSEVLNSKAYGNSKATLPLALGHDISGQPVVTDLAKMPHLLVAGTTGSGKSVGVNSMILSLLFHSNPDELRLIMVDPKMLELSIYEGIPHLLAPVVTDMKEAANGLRWCVAEMERRYKLLAALGVRNIAGYNKKVKEAIDAGEPLLDPLFEANPAMASLRPDELDPLPYIVIIIDEFADMMMIVGKKVEELIARLAQKARAAGIHLILATQRPSVDVITGLIKANVPTRIAFQVSSKIDSRTILDQMGAESLLGNGDMLYLAPGTGLPLRVHGAFVSDEEVHAVVDDLKSRGHAEYIDEILTGEGVGPVVGVSGEQSGDESDPLYDEAVAIVMETRRASISGIQRRLKVGYNRAARMVEDMESAGLVSPVQSNGQREVLVPKQPQ